MLRIWGKSVLGCLVAFFGAFRVTELVAGYRGNVPDRTLKLSDIQLGPEFVQIALQRPKTDQTGKEALISLGSCVDSDLCLVAEVCQYFVVWG